MSAFASAAALALCASAKPGSSSRAASIISAASLSMPRSSAATASSSRRLGSPSAPLPSCENSTPWSCAKPGISAVEDSRRMRPSRRTRMVMRCSASADGRDGLAACSFFMARLALPVLPSETIAIMALKRASMSSGSSWAIFS